MTHMTTCVDIVMATYNGAAHLAEQIASIQAQQFKNWRLLIRDDGSQDETANLLADMAKRDSRIQVVKDSLGNLGVVANFGHLLELTEAEFIFLCDQDDVWLPSKLSDFLDYAKALNESHGAVKPLLIFSDLQLVDDKLKVLASSYMQMQQRGDCLDLRFRNLLTQNVMPGCAMMVNRTLLERALPIPKCAGMHDWWLILVAACFGSVQYLNRPLAAYRQHPFNVMGAVKPSIKSLFGQGLQKYMDRLRAGERQAQAFIDRYQDQMKKNDLIAATCLATLSQKSFIKRRVDAYRNGLRKDGFFRTLVFYTLM